MHTNLCKMPTIALRVALDAGGSLAACAPAAKRCSLCGPGKPSCLTHAYRTGCATRGRRQRQGTRCEPRRELATTFATSGFPLGAAPIAVAEARYATAPGNGDVEYVDEEGGLKEVARASAGG